MIKVLHVVKALEKNGVTSVILTYSHNIDRTNFQLDVLTGDLYEEQYREQLETDGCRFFVIRNRDKSILSYINSLKQVIKTGQYDVVHVHGNSAMIFPELMAAKLANVKVRIAHSHNTMCNHPKLEKVVRPIFDHLYTHGIACSIDAGRWMFKDRKFTVMNNGIAMDDRKYSESDRQSTRDELHVNDEEILIGHVGFFNYQKNHTRLISIFEKICKEQTAKLLLVGDGPDRKMIEDMVYEKNLSDKVIFYGQSTNVARLMSAMDVFVLPSNFEGMPVVILEAQASGMKCITSANVPEAASAAIVCLRLDEDDDLWEKCIIQGAKENLGVRYDKSDEYRSFLEYNKYGAHSVVDELEKYYVEGVNS